MTTRRDFLRRSLIAGAALFPASAFAQMRRQGRFRAPLSASEIPSYRFKIIALADWAGLKADFETVRAGDGFSRHSTFRTAMNALDFGLPGDFPGAKAVIVLATFAKSATADFTMNGRVHRILIPFQYYADEWTPERLSETVRKDILKDPGRRVIDISKRVPLKYLAGRSGLGDFGRSHRGRDR